MITAVPGVRVGHWTDPEARTGCTVVLLPTGTVASGEVRGGAPGTREWALLDPGRTVAGVDAVVLAGGSAFGLAACDGVARWCEERSIGFPTPAGPVPIVVGMVLYDLGVGDPRVRPGPAEGYAACEAAVGGTGPAGDRGDPGGNDARLVGTGPVGTGPVGAGAGATIGKWRGPGAGRAAGLGSAVYRHRDLTVAALVALNAVGEPRLPEGSGGAERAVGPRLPTGTFGGAPPGMLATTVGVVVSNAAVDKAGCLRVAQSGHDGLARALDPVHTAGDGDALVAAATGAVVAPVEVVRSLAAWVVEQAVLDAAG
ncbi:MAG: P1 family peptidase [Acidimicrobiales bacterium]